MKRGGSVAVFIGAALVGAAGGWMLAREHDSGNRRHLFSQRPYRRFAALGWIATQDDPENLPLLRDYLAWEPLPALRRRARHIVAAFESAA
jgi:hypothetical protein